MADVGAADTDGGQIKLPDMEPGARERLDRGGRFLMGGFVAALLGIAAFSFQKSPLGYAFMTASAGLLGGSAYTIRNEINVIGRVVAIALRETAREKFNQVAELKERFFGPRGPNPPAPPA